MLASNNQPCGPTIAVISWRLSQTTSKLLAWCNISELGDVGYGECNFHARYYSSDSGCPPQQLRDSEATARSRCSATNASWRQVFPTYIRLHDAILLHSLGIYLLSLIWIRESEGYLVDLRNFELYFKSSLVFIEISIEPSEWIVGFLTTFSLWSLKVFEIHWWLMFMLFNVWDPLILLYWIESRWMNMNWRVDSDVL